MAEFFFPFLCKRLGAFLNTDINLLIGHNPNFCISYPPKLSVLQICLPNRLYCIPINPVIRVCCDINLLARSHFQHQLRSTSADIILSSKRMENSAALEFLHPLPSQAPPGFEAPGRCVCAAANGWTRNIAPAVLLWVSWYFVYMLCLYRKAIFPTFALHWCL